jgi:two-component system, NtrC family, nitrogen regulation response regulator NtrX
MHSDILVVDDEDDIRELVSGILEDEGYTTRLAKDSDEAQAEVTARRPGLVFLDIWLQGSQYDGLELLDIFQKQHPGLPIVMISGHGNIETAVSAIKRGAYDFIEKPFKADRLILLAERALEASRLKREINELRRKTGEQTGIVGRSPVMSHLRAMIERIAATNSRILITGPSGAGKELVARNIHQLSERRDGPFVVLNAASLDPLRWEAELFGREELMDGERKVGLLEAAHGGTLYIDEVVDMPYETQGKVLRVLVDQNFERVGGANRVHVDVRIISSSSRDIDSEIAEGRFRGDLYHRLGVVPVGVPSLTERRTDIPELIEHLIDQIALSTGLPRRRLGADAVAVLQSLEWPGNVRQLRNNLERTLILVNGDPDTEITADMLPPEVGNSLSPSTNGSGGDNLMAMPLKNARENFEREYLLAQISRFGGNVTKTAEFVGMERSALHRKLKSLGVGSLERLAEAVQGDQG